MTDEPETDTAVVLRPAPPPGASHADHINWLMECGCELGRMVCHFAREIEASDEQLTLIFHYMAGRAIGCYVKADDDKGRRACLGIYELGVDHGKRANEDEQFEVKANAEGTETRQ